MPLQFRRGPDSDRLTITPAVAEPVFTTDTKRLFVGDGSTAGGIEIQGSVDSAATIALIDSAYVQARSPLTTTADFPDSAGVNSLIDTRVNATFINNLTIDADTLGGQAGSHYLNYNNFTNTPTIPTLGTSFVDSAEARELISVTDAGGDGSLAYNNSTGVLTYTGPSAAEVRAHFSGGTGVTYTSGTGAIAIGQAVATSDSVTFAGLYVSGDFMVGGTTTTINSTTLTVDDKNIVMADGAADANAADSGGITVAGANAQLFYKSTTDAWNFNKDLAMGGNDVSGVGRLTATGAISTTDSAVFGGNGSTGGVKIDDGQITIRTGTGNVGAIDLYCEVNNAHRVRLKAPAHANFSGNPDVVLPNASGTIALTSDITTALSPYAPLANPTFTAGIVVTDSAIIGGNGSTGGVSIDDGYVEIRSGTGTPGYIDFYCEVNNAHRVRLKAPAHSNFSGNPDVLLPTSSGTIALTSQIPTNNNTLINGANYLDSTTVTGVITQAYVNSLGITAGLDSALVSQLVDSSYIQLRQTSAGTLTIQEEGSSLSTAATTLNFVGDGVTASGSGNVKTITITGGGSGSGGGGSGISRADFFHYTATSGQTSFTGADDDGETLSYTPARAAVYLNGILLRDSADYTSTSGDAIVLSTGADSNDIVTIINQGGLDSSLVTGIVDSAYVAARAGGATGGTDSAAVIALIDSAHINARIGSAATLTFTPDVKHARLSMSSSESLSAASWQKVDNLTTRDVDTSTGNVLSDTGNARLVIPAGVAKVKVMAGLATSGIAGQAIAQIYHYNSSGVQQNTRTAINDTDTSGGDDTVAYTSIVDVSQGDYFELHAYGTDTGTITANNNTYFEIEVLEGSILNTVIGSTIQLSDLSNVHTATPTNGQALVWDSANQYWEPGTVASSGGTDSAAVIALIDSDYVQARFRQETALSTFTYTADSGQTAFTGNDVSGTSLQYGTTAQVYLNGILLVDSDDYTRTSNSVLTLTQAANSSDILQIHDFTDVRVSSDLINKNFEYTADSGQTTFSGADNNSATLAYQSGFIQVFLNGILLREADYTASDGTSVVLAEAADSGNTLTISKYGYGTTTSVATWTERSSTAIAAAGEKLFIDCSSGVVTVTLPPTPSSGSEIRVIDATGNAATNNITIGRNGSKINGADSDLTLDVNRAAIGLVYYNTAQGWILMER